MEKIQLVANDQHRWFVFGQNNRKIAIALSEIDEWFAT